MIRSQCPAGGPSPAVSCPRFTRSTASRHHGWPRSTSPASGPPPHTPRPSPPSRSPQTNGCGPGPRTSCRGSSRNPPSPSTPAPSASSTSSARTGTTLHPTWQDAYRPERANIEGLKGRAKSYGIDISDPTKRLAHGRVAQTILLALKICSINLHILFIWQQTTSTRATAGTHKAAVVPTPSPRPPPSAAAPAEGVPGLAYAKEPGPRRHGPA